MGPRAGAAVEGAWCGSAVEEMLLLNRAAEALSALAINVAHGQLRTASCSKLRAIGGALLGIISLRKDAVFGRGGSAHRPPALWLFSNRSRSLSLDNSSEVARRYGIVSRD